MSNLHKEKIELSQQYTDLIERRQFLKTKVEEKMKEHRRAWRRAWRNILKEGTDPNADPMQISPKMGRVWSEEVHKMDRQADSLEEKIKQKEQEWLAMEIKINKRVKDHHRDLERVSKEYNKLYLEYNKCKESNKLYLESNKYNKISKLDHLHPSLKICTDSGPMTVYQIQEEIGSLKKELVKKYNEYWKYKKLHCEALRDIEKLKIGEGQQKIVRFQLKNNSTIRGPPKPPSLRNPTARVLKEATQSKNKTKKTTSTSPEKPKGPCDACRLKRYSTNRGCGGRICDFAFFS